MDYTQGCDTQARLATTSVAGKEGVITDTIPAIKADKTLNLEAKRALISLVRALRNTAG